MLFNRDDPQLTAPKIEAQLRKELGRAAPLPFTVTTEPGFQPATGMKLGQALAALGRGGPDALYTVGFRLDEPLPWEAHFAVIRTIQLYVMVGSISYLARLPRPAHGPAQLEEQRPRFAGDEALCATLNGDVALVRKLAAFARTQLKFGESRLTVPRQVAITPTPEGSLLRVQTLPVLTWFGMRSRFEPQAFLALAQQVAARL